MVDNINVDPGTGVGAVPVATDDVGGIQYQVIKLATGGDGTATVISNANPVPISDAGGTLTVDGTVTVNGISATAPDRGAGAATAQTLRVTMDSGQVGALGQAAMAASQPVVIASDQTALTTQYAAPANFVSGVTAAMTGTTTTSLIAAPAAGLRNYITQITVSNSHATVGTDVVIQDGSGGATLYTIPAAPAYGGAVLTFPTPLRQPSTATAIFCANVTTGSNIKVSASGYKGA